MKLPCEECKGKCCYHVAMSSKEFKALRKKYGVPKCATVEKFESITHESYTQKILVTIYKEDGRCGYFKDNKCSVYDLRPKVCKEYGEIENLPCEYLDKEKAMLKQNERMIKAGVYEHFHNRGIR